MDEMKAWKSSGVTPTVFLLQPGCEDEAFADQVKRASGQLLSGKSMPRAAAATHANTVASAIPSSENLSADDGGELRLVTPAPATTVPTAIHW
jgi:hypothetical protein